MPPWTGLAIGLAIVALAATTGLVYQARGVTRDRRRYPPPGRLIDVGGFRLHLHETGQGSPPVLLEAGIAASSVSWSLVQPALAAFTRVCSYDRAGLAWSDAASTPRTARQLIEELHELVVRAPIERPFVLVGHSFGGLLARLYAARYPGELAGLVLVDPLAPGEWLRPDLRQRRLLRGAVFLSRAGALLARLGVVRLCLSLLSGGRPGPPRHFARIFGPEAVAFLLRIVGEVTKLPATVHPVVQAHWCRPGSFRAMAAHLEALPRSVAEAIPVGLPRDVPCLTLSAGRSPRRAPPDVGGEDAMGEHVVTAESGHWIQLDRPDLVVDAVRTIVGRARSGRAADPERG